MKKGKYGARSKSAIQRVATKASAVVAKAQAYRSTADLLELARSVSAASFRGENTFL
jgi:hypothetical protein